MTDEISPAVEAAQIKKLEAEARFYEESAYNKALHNWDLDKSKKQIQASMDANREYPFWSVVNKATAGACMDTLSQWTREDPNKPITVIFNSPGGSVFDGLALYDHILHLRGAGHDINTTSLGYAASMGGILLQAGSTRTMGPHAYMMIHEISSGAIGNASEIEDELVLIRRLQERALNILSERSHLSKTKIKRNWKRKDWWIDASEALELGLIDKIEE